MSPLSLGAIGVSVGEHERFEMLVSSESNKNTEFDENKPAHYNWNSLKARRLHQSVGQRQRRQEYLLGK